LQADRRGRRNWIVRIDVLLIGDLPGVREDLRAAPLGARVDVVGEAAAGVEGLRLASELRPDVVLLDLDLPDKVGSTCSSAYARSSPASACSS